MEVQSVKKPLMDKIWLVEEEFRSMMREYAWTSNMNR